MRPALRIRLTVALFLTGMLVMAAPWARAQEEQTVDVTAKRYSFTPSAITVRKGVPVVLRLTTQDRTHGFSCPDLKLRSDITPGKEAIIRFVPDRTGTFIFSCDVFCGEGHDEMSGTITVTD